MKYGQLHWGINDIYALRYKAFATMSLWRHRLNLFIKNSRNVPNLFMDDGTSIMTHLIGLQFLYLMFHQRFYSFASFLYAIFFHMHPKMCHFLPLWRLDHSEHPEPYPSYDEKAKRIPTIKLSTTNVVILAVAFTSLLSRMFGHWNNFYSTGGKCPPPYLSSLHYYAIK